MSRIKIDVAGWDHFNGHLGTIEFENGISKRELTQQEMHRLGANLKIVRVDNNEQVGASVIMANIGHVSAELTPALPTLAEQKEAAQNEEPELKYTRAVLNEIADKQGIKGIRKIAAEYGVKGVQISAMIDEIIEAQSPKEE